MSAMGQAVLEVQEDIIEMLTSGMSIKEIDDLIVKNYGSMFRGMVDDVLMEAV